MARIRRSFSEISVCVMAFIQNLKGFGLTQIDKGPG